MTIESIKTVYGVRVPHSFVMANVIKNDISEYLGDIVPTVEEDGSVSVGEFGNLWDIIVEIYYDSDNKEIKAYPGLKFYLIPHDQQEVDDSDDSDEDEEDEATADKPTFNRLTGEGVTHEDIIIGVELYNTPVYAKTFIGRSPDFKRQMNVIKKADELIKKYKIPGDVQIYNIQNDCRCCS